MLLRFWSLKFRARKVKCESFSKFQIKPTVSDKDPQYTPCVLSCACPEDSCSLFTNDRPLHRLHFFQLPGPHSAGESLLRKVHSSQVSLGQTHATTTNVFVSHAFSLLLRERTDCRHQSCAFKNSLVSCDPKEPGRFSAAVTGTTNDFAFFAFTSVFPRHAMLSPAAKPARFCGFHK